MSIYGNLSLNNNTMTFDSYMESFDNEVNNFNRIIESINILNENGIILEAEETKFAKLKAKIKELVGKLIQKFKDFVKFIGEKFNKLLEKLKIKRPSLKDKVEQLKRSAVKESSMQYLFLNETTSAEIDEILNEEIEVTNYVMIKAVATNSVEKFIKGRDSEECIKLIVQNKKDINTYDAQETINSFFKDAVIASSYNARKYTIKEIIDYLKIDDFFKNYNNIAKCVNDLKNNATGTALQLGKFIKKLDDINADDFSTLAELVNNFKNNNDEKEKSTATLDYANATYYYFLIISTALSLASNEACKLYNIIWHKFGKEVNAEDQFK